MSVFQYLALSFLTLALLWELVEIWRRPVLGAAWFVRCLVWVAAGLAIASPDTVTQIANVIGIDRGADLVVYLFVLTFLAATFYFYARQVRLRRQLTQVVRHIAIWEAQRGQVEQRADPLQ